MNISISISINDEAGQTDSYSSYKQNVSEQEAMKFIDDTRKRLKEVKQDEGN